MKTYKYPRSPHLVWSRGLSSDDRLCSNLDFLKGDVVVTEKLDGSNFTLYRNNIHARSLDGRNHESYSWIKALHASIRNDIPENIRLCGEYLYAKHSIYYTNLTSYFYLFSVWDGEKCLPWSDVEFYSEILDIPTVPVLYKGKLPKDNIHEFVWNLDEENHEGYVIRNSGSFELKDFDVNLAKYVRANHVTTSNHWLYEKIIPNKLA